MISPSHVVCVKENYKTVHYPCTKIAIYSKTQENWRCGESCFGSLFLILPLLTNFRLIWGCPFPNLMSTMDP